MSFVNDYLNKRCDLEAIHNYIDEWHQLVENGISLHTHLGLTLEEYSKWLKHPLSLYSILQERMK